MQGLDSQIAVYCAQRRDELVAADTGTDPALRCDRMQIAPGCRLKHGDDVELNGTVVRVVCAAEALDWFNGLTIEGPNFVMGQYQASLVTDRIPADPLETALPIFEEPA